MLAPVPAAADPRTGRRDASVRSVVTVAVLGAVLLAAHFAVFTFIAPVLATAGPQRLDTGLALLVFGTAGVLGLMGAPRLLGSTPRQALPVTGFALGATILGVAAAGTELAMLTALALWGLVVGALPVVFQTRLLTLASDSFRPMAGAILVVAFNLGIAAGAAFGGAVHTAIGAGSLPAVAGTLATAAALALIAVRSR